MDDQAINIRPAAAGDAPLLADLIRQAFADVARRFGLTPHNCPKHPSNCTQEWINGDQQRGAVYYILEVGAKAAGCVAMENAPHGMVYLERLAVLPAHRRAGLGNALLEHVIGKSRSSGADKVGIGIIAAQDELKDWYARRGFRETGTRQFEHLPFDVTFMEYTLNG